MINSDHYGEQDDEDDIPEFEERDANSHVSEDEYESEEDMVYPFDRHMSRNHVQIRRLSSYSSQMPAKPTTSLLDFGNESSNHLIDRLRIEMAGLRRQSAEAVSLSLRMSDQLAEAQADATRARAALRNAESMLEDEERKRREAEITADEEAKKRLAAEEALKVMQMQLCRSS